MSKNESLKLFKYLNICRFWKQDENPSGDSLNDMWDKKERKFRKMYKRIKNRPSHVQTNATFLKRDTSKRILKYFVTRKTSNSTIVSFYHEL